MHLLDPKCRGLNQRVDDVASQPSEVQDRPLKFWARKLVKIVKPSNNTCFRDVEHEAIHSEEEADRKRTAASSKTACWDNLWSRVVLFSESCGGDVILLGERCSAVVKGVHTGGLLVRFADSASCQRCGGALERLAVVSTKELLSGRSSQGCWV